MPRPVDQFAQDNSPKLVTHANGVEASRCLVVDDEPRLRQALVRLMQGAGFRCFEASSAQDALAVLAREPLELVLSDMRMPGMDGATLLRRIRGGTPRRRGRDDHRGGRSRSRGVVPLGRRDGLHHQALHLRRSPGARHAGIGEAPTTPREPRLSRAARGARQGAGAAPRGSLPRERAIAGRGVGAQGSVHARSLHSCEPIRCGDQPNARASTRRRSGTSSWAANCTTSERSACARTCSTSPARSPKKSTSTS